MWVLSNPAPFTRKGKLVEKLLEDYFSFAAYTNFIIDCIDERKDDSKPFFAYCPFRRCTPFAAPVPMTPS
jgi:hypothetical protein